MGIDYYRNGSETNHFSLPANLLTVVKISEMERCIIWLGRVIVKSEITVSFVNDAPSVARSEQKF